jgi:hypothetical protein
VLRMLEPPEEEEVFVDVVESAPESRTPSTNVPTLTVVAVK